MGDRYLHRGDAPFGEGVWERIDEAVAHAAKSQLSGRRLLHIEGPYGLGVKALPLPDCEAETKPTVEGVTVSASGSLPLALLQSAFTLSVRDVAAFEERGVPLDVSPAVQAAFRCARQEDHLLFTGAKAFGLDGLLTAKGVQKVACKDWAEVGDAVDAVIEAVTTLDEAGFHGPYALALAPARYNLLFRRYPQGNQTELGHLEAVVTEGLVKAPSLESGGVLVAAGRPFASIAVGQDLLTGFVGPSGTAYEFVITESIALRLRQPEAVCLLQ